MLHVHSEYSNLVILVLYENVEVSEEAQSK